MDAKKTAGSLVFFLQSCFRSAGFSKAVIGLSGGVDSAVSCALVVRTLGAENVHPVLLPYGSLHLAGTNDAQSVITSLGIPPKNVRTVDIAPAVDALVRTDPDMDRVRRGNVMARVRMTILFDIAKKLRALVVGTENKSEHLLGYFTRFGDSASDVEPLRNLYKTQVYELAKFLRIPKNILTKAPTAGLWEGQTDEGEFGFSYTDADKILRLLHDEKKTIEQVVSAGFDRETVERVASRVKNNTFKHTLPLVPPM